MRAGGAGHSGIWKPGWGSPLPILQPLASHLPSPGPALLWSRLLGQLHARPHSGPVLLGVLEMWRKVVLMARWQVSTSAGTSASVRPLVGMASNTCTVTVPEVNNFFLVL